MLGEILRRRCAWSRERNGPAIVAQALNYPCPTDELSAPSYAHNAESAGVTTRMMSFFWDQYLGDRRISTNAYATPLKSSDFRDLPPAHVHIAEFDPLADDGRHYAQALRDAGTEVELRCAERMIHGFIRARFCGPASVAEYQAVCDFLHRHLFRP